MSLKDQFGGSNGVKQSLEAEYNDGSDDVQGTEQGFVTKNTACCLPEQ